VQAQVQLGMQPAVQAQPPQDQQPMAGLSGLQPAPHQHFLDQI